MEKFLFINGSDGIKELHSSEELESHIASVSNPSAIRIWRFGGKEWLTLSQYRSLQQPLVTKPTTSKKQAVSITPDQPSPLPRKLHWIRNTIILAACVIVAFLIYNFTRITWHAASPLLINAIRPHNSPPMNVDSLLYVIEGGRGQKIDKITRTNLRIRNTWPDRILLQLRSDRDTSSAGTRFHNLSVTIDNATGYLIASAKVRVDSWRAGEITRTDTVSFTNINYTQPASLEMSEHYEGDSLSVSFISIQAPVFNFCYAASKQSNYGNMNDRWFCKD